MTSRNLKVWLLKHRAKDRLEFGIEQGLTRIGTHASYTDLTRTVDRYLYPVAIEDRVDLSDSFIALVAAIELADVEHATEQHLDARRQATPSCLGSVTRCYEVGGSLIPTAASVIPRNIYVRANQTEELIQVYVPAVAKNAWGFITANAIGEALNAVLSQSEQTIDCGRAIGGWRGPPRDGSFRVLGPSSLPPAVGTDTRRCCTRGCLPRRRRTRRSAPRLQSASSAPRGSGGRACRP